MRSFVCIVFLCVLSFSLVFDGPGIGGFYDGSGINRRHDGPGLVQRSEAMNFLVRLVWVRAL